MKDIARRTTNLDTFSSEMLDTNLFQLREEHISTALSSNSYLEPACINQDDRIYDEVS